MKRILIIGCPGSGKSYFAKRLGEITKLPVIHMDNIYWKKDKTSISKEELMKVGLNDSVNHVDFMVGTKDLNITAVCENGEELVVFKNGNWNF